MRRVLLVALALLLCAWHPALAQYGGNYGQQQPGYQPAPAFTPAQLPGIQGWWMTSAGVTLAVQAVVKAGTTPPTATIVGTPSSTVAWVAGITSIEIDITTGGALGTALFQWKLLGSVQQTGQTTATSFALGSTGLTAGFPAGTYATNNVYTTSVVLSAMTDQSGNGNSLAQNALNEDPYYTTSDANFAGFPSASSLGAGSTTLLIKTFGAALTSPWTICLAVRLSATDSSEHSLMGGPSSHWDIFSYPYHASPGWNASSGAALEGTNNSSFNTAAHAICFVAGSSGAEYIDSSTTANITGNSGTNTFEGIEWGYAGAIGGSLPWVMVETAVWNVGLTASQVHLIFAYYSSRYGIASSANDVDVDWRLALLELPRVDAHPALVGWPVPANDTKRLAMSGL